MKKEAITHGVLEDLANRNDNWDKLDGVPEKVDGLENQFNDVVENATSISPSDIEIVASRSNVLTGKNYQTLGSRLDIENEIVSDKLSEFYQNGYFYPNSKIYTPKELELSLPISIRKTGVGNFESNIVPESLFPDTLNGVTYYVDIINGSNSNDGLTLATAFRNVSKVWSQPNVETILLAEGIYDKDTFAEINKDVKIKALPGNNVVVGGFASELIFTQETGDVYKTVRSLTIGVWDMSNTDEKGYYIPLIKKHSISDVADTPNSWYYDETNKNVYVHTFNKRVPDKNIMVSIKQTPLVINGNRTVYLEGVKFCFGTGVEARPNSLGQPTLLAKNCEFSYSDIGNGLNIMGATLVVLSDCESSFNFKDGFNYHDALGNSGEFIEVGCIGNYNGRDNTGINNGSTAHENYKGVRIAGQYSWNEGPNIADVGNSKTFNVGCVASYSRTTTGIQSDFLSSSKMWIDNCYSIGTNYSILVSEGGSAIVKNSLMHGITHNNPSISMVFNEAEDSPVTLPELEE